MVLIAPSILSADFMNLGNEIKAARDAGADLIHVDVMDGHFVPNITIGQSIVKQISKIAELPLDVHLMIEEPDRYLKEFVDAGADTLTVHFESSIHLHRTIQWIKGSGIKAGVSLNPATPVWVLENILQEIDVVLIMSVNPGFGGQEFIPQTINKVESLKRMIDDQKLNVSIEVDGGVNPYNATDLVNAGADILVMGSAFFNSKEYSETVRITKESVC